MPVNERGRGEKAVGLLRRFESLHLAFASACRTMRVFRAIAQISALSMFNIGKQLALSHAVASQLIGHDHARHILKAFQQPTEETLRGVGIPPWLNEDVEHNANLIHDTPEIVLHALEPYERFVEVPCVSWTGPAAAQMAGKGLAEFLAPAPDRLIGSDNASFSRDQLDIPQAEAERMIQPNGMADDLGWKTVAVMRVGRWLHAASLLGLQSGRQIRLT
jgi:hypothetical protein